MPIIYQQQINKFTSLAIWQIDEDENFFKQQVLIDSNIVHPKKRLQHIAGRFLLSFLQPNFPIKNIYIDRNRKPILMDKSIHFSIAHTQNYAAAIISSHYEVGIDIEPRNNKVKLIAHKFIHDDELKLNISNHDEINFLTLCWCVKEAIYKLLGIPGLSFKNQIRITEINTSTIEVTCFINGLNVQFTLYYLWFNGIYCVYVVS